MGLTKEELKREEAKARRELLEALMLHQLKALKLDTGMVREFKFCDSRLWRADFAWPNAASPLLVEVDGGVYSGGRHTRPAGFEADCEKTAMAAVMGYRVIRATGKHVRSGMAVEWIKRALSGAPEKAAEGVPA